MPNFVRTDQAIGVRHYVTSSGATVPPPAHEIFIVLWDNRSNGHCCVCQRLAHGTCWGAGSYVMCHDCAVGLGAPNLRRRQAWHAGVFKENPPLVPDAEISEYNAEEKCLVTKRDHDFDPASYVSHPDGQDQNYSGSSGCAAYRCTTTVAPLRTIKAHTPFYAGMNNQGLICADCFNRLKAEYERLGLGANKATCKCCNKRGHKSTYKETVYDGLICGYCAEVSYIKATKTDGGLIKKDGAVFCRPGGGLHVWASLRYAQAHWFRGRDQWYDNQQDADESLYTYDVAYRAQRLLLNQHDPVFNYGTNIIKMLGFPRPFTPVDSLCFGVELEMLPNGKHTHRQVVDALGGKWVKERPYILCRDGSLGETGVEMITLPFTLAEHKKDKAIPWTKLLGDLRKVAMSGKGTQACGMHVHINARVLSQLTKGKMLVVINAPEMQELIACIAQRNAARWCARTVKKIADGKIVTGDHYEALNVATNKGTCELRIFRGNLRWERVMKNLEFADALCNYAQQQSMRMLSSPDSLLGWLQSNRAHYPHLVKFLTEEYKPGKRFAEYVGLKSKGAILTPNDALARVTVNETDGDI